MMAAPSPAERSRVADDDARVETIAVAGPQTSAVHYALEMHIGAAWERLPEDRLYDSREEAERELKDHLVSCVDAVEEGFLADGPDADDFRVVEVVA